MFFAKGINKIVVVISKARTRIEKRGAKFQDSKSMKNDFTDSVHVWSLAAVLCSVSYLRLYFSRSSSTMSASGMLNWENVALGILLKDEQKA